MLEPTSENVEPKPKTIQMLIQCSFADIVHRNRKNIYFSKIMEIEGRDTQKGR